MKEMEFIADTTGIMSLKIKPNFKVLGKTYGARMKEIAAAFGALEQPVIAAIQKAEAAGESLYAGPARRRRHPQSRRLLHRFRGRSRLAGSLRGLPHRGT